MRVAPAASLAFLVLSSVVSPESLFDAARSGTAAQVRSALQDGADVNAADGEGAYRRPHYLICDYLGGAEDHPESKYPEGGPGLPTSFIALARGQTWAISSSCCPSVAEGCTSRRIAGN
jgi:hypothetical protein